MRTVPGQAMGEIAITAGMVHGLNRKQTRLIAAEVHLSQWWAGCLSQIRLEQ